MPNDAPALPIDDEPEATPDVVSVPPGAVVAVEAADPEPDEMGDAGDRVELVSTGWIRFTIAGHGRVRLRPARFGQLRKIMEIQEAMLDAIQEVADEVGIRGAALQALADADEKAEITADERERRRRGYMKDSRTEGRRITKVAQDKRAEVWRVIHGMLGVAGESWPDDDDLPVWMLDATLMNQAIVHWQSVPLAPGPASA